MNAYRSLLASIAMLAVLPGCVTMGNTYASSWHRAGQCSQDARWDDGVRLRARGFHQLPPLDQKQYWDMVALWKQQTGDRDHPEYFHLFESDRQPDITHVVAVVKGCVVNEEQVAQERLHRFLNIRNS